MEKLNNKFWFWIGLSFINLLTLSFIINSDDKFAVSFAGCMLFLCLAKSLKCATELDNEG